jgi:hypothetical protein
MEGCVCGCLYVGDNRCSLEHGRSAKLLLYLQDDCAICHVEYYQYSLRSEADCCVRFFRLSYVSDVDSVIMVLI